MGEAWRRYRAKSYAQQEDRAKAAMYQPTLERIWRGFQQGHRLVCAAAVDRETIVVGTQVLLLLTGATAIVAHRGETLGRLDETSLAHLREGLEALGPDALPMTEFVVTVDSVGDFADEFTVVLSKEDLDGE